MRFKTLLGIFLIVLCLFIIYQLVLKIIGGSLGAIELLGALGIANITYSFHLTKDFSFIRGKFEQFEKRFDRMETRFESQENEFRKFEEKFSKFENKLQLIDEKISR